MEYEELLLVEGGPTAHLLQPRLVLQPGLRYIWQHLHHTWRAQAPKHFSYREYRVLCVQRPLNPRQHLHISILPLKVHIQYILSTTGSIGISVFIPWKLLAQELFKEKNTGNKHSGHRNYGQSSFLSTGNTCTDKSNSISTANQFRICLAASGLVT